MNNNVFELAEKCPNITISCTLTDMLQFGKMILEGAAKQKADELAKAENEMYFSPAQVAKLLDVDLSTLWRWEKHNYLVGVRVGGKKRYRKSDIDKIMEGSK